MLCPQCLTPSGLQPAISPDGVRTWTCPNPKCKKTNIPYRYTEDYASFPSVPVCIVGNTGHGKTAYLAGTFKQLDTISNFNRWPGFLTEALDDVQYLQMREKLSRYENGISEKMTDYYDMPDPVVIRCHAIPRVGGCQLIFLDNAGEAFDDTSVKTMKSGPYLANNSTVVWLASLTDGTEQGLPTPPQELIKTVVTYKTAIANLGASTKNQTVILTLTKGERLVSLKGFPASAKAILQDDLTDRAADPWAKLEIVHHDLRDWLLTTQYAGLINQFSVGFKQLRICVISAQGREFDESEQRSFEPKAILSPLFWLWRIERPGVWVEVGVKKEFFLSLSEALRIDWPAGAVVRIQEGVHHLGSAIELKKPITLRGDGDRTGTIIRGRGGEFVFGIGTAGTVHFENLSVERIADVGDVVRIMGGTFTATSVAFKLGITPADPENKYPIGNGLSAGKNTTVTLKACHFQGNGRAGLWGFGSAKLELTDCSIHANKHGMILTAACAATVLRTSFDSNRHHGIWIHDQCRLDMIEGRSNANKKEGLRAVGTARIALMGVACVGNLGRGVELRDNTEAKIDGGQFHGNRDGIALIGESRAEIVRIAAQGNVVSGVVSQENSGGKLANATLTGNAAYGLHLGGNSTLDAKACETRGNTVGGGLVEKTVHGRVSVVDCGQILDKRRNRFGL